MVSSIMKMENVNKLLHLKKDVIIAFSLSFFDFVLVYIVGFFYGRCNNK